MVIQVIFRDPRSGAEQKYEFDQSPIRIGRNPLNNIVLEGNFVSGWHGIIRFDDSGTYYFDLGSTNGTCLDGNRLQKNTPIPIAQTTRLTIWMFELTIIPGAPASLGASPAPQKSPPRPFPVETLVGSGRSTEVLSIAAAAQPAANVSHSQVHGAQPFGSPYVPAGSAPPASQISPSRIVSAGMRTPVQAPPASPRHPSQITGSRQQPANDSYERIARLMRIIGAFADAFMGLKKGYEQFGAEVGVRPLRGSTRLHRARTSQEVMDYVLDPAMDPDACARDLNAVFADMGIHDLALIEGISQSVRSLLAKLDPNSLDLKASAGLWSGGKAKAKWTSYVDAFNNLLVDESAFHAEIFGEEFAAGYASVARGGEDPKDADDSE